MTTKKSEVSVEDLQKELAALKKEVATLKRELGKVKSSGGADPRLDKIIKVLKEGHAGINGLLIKENL